MPKKFTLLFTVLCLPLYAMEKPSESFSFKNTYLAQLPNDLLAPLFLFASLVYKASASTEIATPKQSLQSILVENFKNFEQSLHTLTYLISFYKECLDSQQLHTTLLQELESSYTKNEIAFLKNLFFVHPEGKIAALGFILGKRLLSTHENPQGVLEAYLNAPPSTSLMPSYPSLSVLPSLALPTDNKMLALLSSLITEELNTLVITPELSEKAATALYAHPQAFSFYLNLLYKNYPALPLDKVLANLLTVYLFHKIDKARLAIYLSTPQAFAWLNNYLQSCKDQQQITDCLCLAAELGNQKAASLALKHGADINGYPSYCSRLNRTIKVLVEEHEEFHPVRSSITLPAHQSPLLIATLCNHVSMVKYLLEHKANVNTHDERGCSPLLAAAMYNNKNKEIVKFLLQHSAQVNQPNNQGVTPLMCSMACVTADIAELLIQHGADVNAFSVDSINALMFAALAQNIEGIELLLKHKANPDLQQNGRTAIDYVEQCIEEGENKEIILHLLKSAHPNAS